MEYFKDRALLLRQLSKEDIDKEFMNKLLDLVDDMAKMIDDCIDGVDELDERFNNLKK